MHIKYTVFTEDFYNHYTHQTCGVQSTKYNNMIQQFQLKSLHDLFHAIYIYFSALQREKKKLPVLEAFKLKLPGVRSF